MATPAIEERAISTATAAQATENRTQQQEIPGVFQVTVNAPQVSKGFWSKVVRWSEEYAEYKLTTGYWNLFRI